MSNATYVKAWRHRNNAWIRSLKDEPCLDCGGKFHYSAMQFDHVRGEKKFAISLAMSTTYSKERVLEEIAKCDLVCANCHAIRTWQRMSIAE
jgi:hypothetical protein